MRRIPTQASPPMSETPHKSLFVTSQDGTRIWAEDGGNKNGIPVVFVHGLACTNVVWNLQFSDPALKEKLYMIRYELRGHGRSDHPFTPDKYSTQSFADDFVAVCKEFGVVKPFVCAW